MPIVLVSVLLILIALLRSLVAPLILVAAVVAVWGATLGLGGLVFEPLFGFQGTDPGLGLLSFVFLVALGVDYGIFLMHRMREEAIRGAEPVTAALTALRTTGGVIASAGLVLAATFGVLLNMGLVALVQLGFVIAVGVLLDTFLVRTYLVTSASVALARSARADLVVMDIRMPDLDGIEATRLIAADEDLAGVKVLVLTTYDTDENIVEALRAGASGFLVKDTRPAELLDAIRTVAAGEALLSPGPTARLIARLLRSPAAPVAAGPECLSEREREVLTLVARGLNNTEIAEALGLSPLTAKTHVTASWASWGRGTGRNW